MKNIIINLKTILISILIICAGAVIFANYSFNTEKSYFMMDTYVTVTAKGLNSKRAVDAAYLRLKEIESKMNSHSSDSDVSKKAFDEDLLYVLNKGIYYGDVSNGYFDITVKPVTSLWGIGSQNPSVPPHEKITEAKKFVDYKKIVINNNNVSVPEGFEIDLGGIAKGYAADEAAKVLKEYGINDAVINLGGNVYALGTKRIGLQNPMSQNGDYMGIITVSDCSVATSGAYERYFEQNGQVYHHIIDPFTGNPCETDLLSATVISDLSIDADCLSTILFMSGSEKAAQLAEQLNVSYILIDKDLTVHTAKNINIEITNDSFEVKINE